jgi:hypothetical protein
MSTTTEETALTEIRHEAEVDTKLAEIMSAQDKQAQAISYAKRGLQNACSFRDRFRDEEPTLAEVITVASEKVAAPDAADWFKNKVSAYLQEIADAQYQIRVLRDEAAPLNAEFYAEQWSRFFLVNNNNGHIHSSMSCSTCFFDTSFGWLPELSGLTEKDAVEAYGAILCSICYPSAPVEWTNGISHVAQAEKDERAAAKAERDATKAAKAITNPDGSTLRGYGSYGGEIKTLVTARRELTSVFKDRRYYGDEDGSRFEFAVKLAEAINFKTGEDIEELLIQAEYKGDAAYNREQRA